MCRIKKSIESENRLIGVKTGGTDMTGGLSGEVMAKGYRYSFRNDKSSKIDW